MKKIVFTSLLFSLLLGLDMKAQGNLQFNQVVFIEMEGTSVSGSTPLFVTNTLIVPPGKVLKIESTSVSYSVGQNGFSSHGSLGWGELFLNDKTITKTQYGASNIISEVRFPIWLKEGTYTLKLKIQSAGITSKGFVSGIEFNVTPP